MTTEEQAFDAAQALDERARRASALARDLRQVITAANLGAEPIRLRVTSNRGSSEPFTLRESEWKMLKLALRIWAMERTDELQTVTRDAT